MVQNLDIGVGGKIMASYTIKHKDFVETVEKKEEEKVEKMMCENCGILTEDGYVYDGQIIPICKTCHRSKYTAEKEFDKSFIYGAGVLMGFMILTAIFGGGT